MLPTTCPICRKTLRPMSNSVLYCQECGIAWDLGKMVVTVDVDAPDHIFESFDLLQEIAEGKVLFAYGRNNLFEPEFRRRSTTVVTGDSDEDWPPIYKGDVLISYQQYVTRYLIHDLPYLMETERLSEIPDNTPANQKLSVTNASLAMIAELMAQVVPTPIITFELDRALVALTSPTWAHTLRVLVNDFDYHWNDLSVSQKSLFLLTCNKLPILKSLAPERVCADLTEAIVEATYYCSTESLSNDIDKSKMTEYVQRLPENKFKVLVEHARSAIPEVTVVTDNNWMLMPHQTIFELSPFFYHVNNVEEYKQHVRAEEFIKSAYALWKTYSSPLLTNEFMKAKKLTVGMSPSATYMTYWNIATERLYDKKG